MTKRHERAIGRACKEGEPPAGSASTGRRARRAPSPPWRPSSSSSALCAGLGKGYARGARSERSPSPKTRPATARRRGGGRGAAAGDGAAGDDAAGDDAAGDGAAGAEPDDDAADDASTAVTHRADAFEIWRDAQALDVALTEAAYSTPSRGAARARDVGRRGRGARGRARRAARARSCAYAPPFALHCRREPDAACALWDEMRAAGATPASASSTRGSARARARPTPPTATPRAPRRRARAACLAALGASETVLAPSRAMWPALRAWFGSAAATRAAGRAAGGGAADEDARFAALASAPRGPRARRARSARARGGARGAPRALSGGVALRAVDLSVEERAVPPQDLVARVRPRAAQAPVGDVRVARGRLRRGRGARPVPDRARATPTPKRPTPPRRPARRTPRRPSSSP